MQIYAARCIYFCLKLITTEINPNLKIPKAPNLQTRFCNLTLVLWIHSSLVQKLYLAKYADIVMRISTFLKIKILSRLISLKTVVWKFWLKIWIIQMCTDIWRFATKFHKSKYPVANADSHKYQPRPRRREYL